MAKFSLDLKDLERMRRDLKRLAEQLITRDLLLEVGEQMREQIYKRTKAGKGLASDTQEFGAAGETALKELSPSYIDFRKGKVAFGTGKSGGKSWVYPKKPIKKPKLGKFGSASRSNLTFTGEMLEAIVVRATGKTIEVKFEAGKRKDGSGKTNEEVARLVAKNGRPFFGISTKQAKIIENFVKRRIRERIREL